MAYYRIEHGDFFDTRIQAIAKAGHIHVNGEAHRDDYMRRLRNCGCADSVAIEVTPAEYRAVVLKVFPQLGK